MDNWVASWFNPQQSMKPHAAAHSLSTPGRVGERTGRVNVRKLVG